ncbi:MAG: 4-hydroxy-tetrahydrodipicolinate synthase [Chitinophagales bacterium]|nr:4-hydroxy-tetrahydrodipicolinate synthase [Chitinophagales bacterium]
MNIPSLRGVGVALVTPFNSQKEVDFDKFEQVINYVIENGVDNIVALGTTGESATLNKEEKQSVINKAVEVADKRVSVIAGFGGNNTMEIVKDLQTFDLTGVDGILSVSPAYNKPTQEGIYEHFKTIALSTDLPIILYNVPGRTSSNIRTTTTLQLAHEFKNIIGIKEASTDWGQILDLARNKPENFLLLSGNDDLIVPQIALGYDGVISVIGNVTPKLFSTMVHSALDGDFDTARRILFELDELIAMMFEQGNPAGAKCALEHIGICSDELRLPLVPVNYDLRKRIGQKLVGLSKEFRDIINHHSKS